MANRIGFRCIPSAFAGRLSLLLSVFACILLLGIASPLAAQVTSLPTSMNFGFNAGTTTSFTITVPGGTTLGSVSVLTQGAPNLDFTAVPAGTTCPTVVSGTCTVSVLFTPQAVGRRFGALVIADPSGNMLISVELFGLGNGPSASFTPGTISTFAGTPGTQGSSGDSNPAIGAQLSGPKGVAFDGFGNLYIADATANTVRMVNPSGIISTFAGGAATVCAQATNSLGDGCPATGAQLNGPSDVLVDGAGSVFIADTGNNVVRVVNQAGVISTFVGGATTVCAAATDALGDGCSATQAILNAPVSLVNCSAQNLFIADKGNNLIRGVNRASGGIVTKAGGANPVCAQATDVVGDGCLPTSALLSGPSGVAIDESNVMYIADQGNNIVRAFALPDGIISTVAGMPGQAGYLGDGGAAAAAKLSGPTGVKVDPAYNLYIADTSNQVIRKVTPGVSGTVSDGTISTVAGFTTTTTGNAAGGYGGDNGPATTALLNGPAGITLDTNQNLYIADYNNFVVRKVDVSDPPTLAFPNTTINLTSPAQDLLLANLGNRPLVITAITTAANFSLGGTDTTCISTGQSLPVAASCILGIEFTPTTTGPLTGSVILADNSVTGSTQTLVLSGTGQLLLAQTITFPSPGTQTYGVGNITLTATSDSSLPVSYAVISGPATVSGSTLTITGAGSVTVEASQAGNINYSPATPVDVTFTVNQEAQTIAFTNPGTQTFGVAPITLVGSATSSLPVSYAVTAGPATVSGSTLTITGAGSVTVQATQAGNVNFLAATPVSVTFTVNQEAQTITFTNPGTQTFGVAPITLVATATSSLPVSFAVTAGPATVSGSTLTITGAGSVTVQATQAGNVNFLAATPVSVTFTVNKVAESYSLSGGSAGVTMKAGASGTTALSLTSTTFAGTVSFTTSVSTTTGTAADVTATATPVTLTAGGTGTSTVTITTVKGAANHAPSVPWKSGTLMFCAVLLGAPFGFRRKRAIAILLVASAISMAGFLMACGSSPSAPRTYAVTVTPKGVATPAGAVAVTDPAPVVITVTVQ